MPGVGDNDHFLAKAGEFCRDFDLALEKTAADSGILAEELNRCRKLKGEWRRRFCERGGRFRNG